LQTIDNTLGGVSGAGAPRRTSSFTSPKARAAHRQERIALVFLKGAGGFVIIAMAFLFGYLGLEGTKTFFVDHVSPLTFLFSPTYAPDAKQPGSLVFIVGSLAITLFAICLGGPIGVAVGVFLSELAPPKMAALLKPSIELLVGIPSVVYGWLGLTLLVPLIRALSGTAGFGLMAAGIVLSIMILPTVITLSEDALKAVSPFLREGSMALGATRWETIWRVVLPTAKSGLAVAIILGVARAIGETLAVQMVIGNAVTLPTSLFSPTSALPTEIVIDMAGAAQGSPLQHALFSMAFLLLLIAMFLILGVKLALRKR
jgi:phosphate transport system permease protein